MTAEGGYTRVSSLLWNWDPFVQLDPTSSRLWLCLYTSSPTKRLIPGLWEGSIAAMSSFAKLPASDTIQSLDNLLERELVEYDQHAGLARLTKLPDAGEWPSNASILLSWWKRFRSAPECAVRDAHVVTIRWLLERGSRDSDKNLTGEVSAKHEAVWAETFGRLKIPASRRRGVRRLVDHDTSTDVQPGLFPSRASSVQTQCDQEVDVEVNDVLSQIPESNKIRVSNTVSTLSGEGEGEGEGEYLSSSPEEGGSGGGGDAGGKPRLVLVPMPAEPPTTAVPEIRDLREKLVACLRRGLSMPRAFECAPGDERALDALLARLASDGIGDRDLPVFEQWLACGGMRLTRQSAHEWTQIAWWVADMNLKRSILTARDWKADAERAQQELAQAMKDAGI